MYQGNDPDLPGVIAAQAELDAVARPLGAYTDRWGTFGDGEQYTMTGLESSPSHRSPNVADSSSACGRCS